MTALPKWAERCLGNKGHDRVEAAIAAAEARTSGEIIPLLVRRSSTVGHVPLLATALLLVIAISLDFDAAVAGWIGNDMAGVVAVWLACAIAGWFASQLDIVDRLLTPQGDQALQVDLRAELEFYELGVGRTSESTGVLLMISLLEHRAVVLADQGISERLPAETWQEVVGLMIAGVKRGDAAGGLCAAIERCGDLLEAHFPIAPGDENELRDHLIVKD
ncbi:MAG: TPM domain-containing protein [Myxococcota bacterium]|nr:TPM domain-containing protein [Myxococcota bacterium]